MDQRYGKKFTSFRKGFLIGKRDAKHLKKLEHTAHNPYRLPSDVLELLKKRARWQAGYDAGWEVVHQRKLKKIEEANGFKVKKKRKKK